MNDRYFGCRQCRTYVDAGYRWAYWQLEEPGLVAIGEPVSIDAIFSATEYWSPQGDDNPADNSDTEQTVVGPGQGYPRPDGKRPAPQIYKSASHVRVDP